MMYLSALAADNLVAGAAVGSVLEDHVAHADRAEVVPAVQDDLGEILFLANQALVDSLSHKFE